MPYAVTPVKAEGRLSANVAITQGMCIVALYRHSTRASVRYRTNGHRFPVAIDTSVAVDDVRVPSITAQNPA